MTYRYYYIDPDKGTAGDGSSIANADNKFPTAKLTPINNEDDVMLVVKCNSTKALNFNDTMYNKITGYRKDLQDIEQNTAWGNNSETDRAYLAIPNKQIEINNIQYIGYVKIDYVNENQRLHINDGNSYPLTIEYFDANVTTGRGMVLYMANNYSSNYNGQKVTLNKCNIICPPDKRAIATSGTTDLLYYIFGGTYYMEFNDCKFTEVGDLTYSVFYESSNLQSEVYNRCSFKGRFGPGSYYNTCYVDSSSKIIYNDCIFEGNVCPNEGNYLWIKNKSPKFNRCRFSRGVYWFNGMNCDDCTFTNLKISGYWNSNDRENRCYTVFKNCKFESVIYTNSCGDRRDKDHGYLKINNCVLKDTTINNLPYYIEFYDNIMNNVKIQTNMTVLSFGKFYNNFGDITFLDSNYYIQGVLELINLSLTSVKKFFNSIIIAKNSTLSVDTIESSCIICENSKIDVLNVVNSYYNSFKNCQISPDLVVMDNNSNLTIDNKVYNSELIKVSPYYRKDSTVQKSYVVKKELGGFMQKGLEVSLTPASTSIDIFFITSAKLTDLNIIAKVIDVNTTSYSVSTDTSDWEIEAGMNKGKITVTVNNITENITTDVVIFTNKVITVDPEAVIH